MTNYWMVKDFLFAFAITYWIVAALAIVCALWLPKTKKTKILSTLATIALVSFFPLQGIKNNFDLQKKQNEYWVKYTKAKDLFENHCNLAGEKIYRTVEKVEGIFIVNMRTEDINFDQQFKLDDPYGYIDKGEDYIRLFIRGRPTIPVLAGEHISPENVVTYRYVETSDESGKGFYRYTTNMKKKQSEIFNRSGGGIIPLSKTHVSSRASLYGIVWEDISSQADRENWIAGSSLKIIDLRTNDILAERIGYMFDQYLGNTAGGRSPWVAARSNACPPLDQKNFYFFDRVIKPSK